MGYVKVSHGEKMLFIIGRRDLPGPQVKRCLLMKREGRGGFIALPFKKLQQEKKERKENVVGTKLAS
jgi:hypothetical protein